jgi:pimeloyl-ACP methyl ester carboxylesterase
MKYTLLILLFIISLGNNKLWSQNSSRIVSYELWQTVSKDELRQRMKERKIPKALLNPRYDVNIYDVKYLSKWHDGSEVLVSGLYFVPQGATAPMPQLVYHHGTTFVKGREQEIKRETNLALGYAVDGYIVLMPDYFGLGHGDKFHIYQQYKPLGQTTVDFLFTAKELNALLKVQVNEQLFLTGYSEGGYAALGANKLIQEAYGQHFKVTATAANAGAYDMAGVQSKAMFNPYARPQFLPYLLMGLNEVYNMVPNINAMYRPPYDTVVQKYFDGYHTHDGLEKLLPLVPKDMLHDTFINLYLSDTNFIMHKALQENTLCYWKPENAVQLCHCKGDKVVFYENSFVAYYSMKQLGAEDITLRNPGKKYTHRGCALFATSYSKFYFDSFIEGNKHGRKGSFAQRFFLSLAKLKKPVTQ